MTGTYDSQGLGLGSNAATELSGTYHMTASCHGAFSRRREDVSGEEHESLSLAVWTQSPLAAHVVEHGGPLRDIDCLVRGWCRFERLYAIYIVEVEDWQRDHPGRGGRGGVCGVADGCRIAIAGIGGQ